jgi:hypothetical protein
VQVPHRGLDVGVAHPVLYAADVGLGNHAPQLASLLLHDGRSVIYVAHANSVTARACRYFCSEPAFGLEPKTFSLQVGHLQGFSRKCGRFMADHSS